MQSDDVAVEGRGVLRREEGGGQLVLTAPFVVCVGSGSGRCGGPSLGSTGRYLMVKLMDTMTCR